MREEKNPSVPNLPVAFATSEEVQDKLIVATAYKQLPVEWPLEPGDQLVPLKGKAATKLKNQADLIHTLRGRDGNVAVEIERKDKTKTVMLPVIM